jgi:hypothetical protein
MKISISTRQLFMLGFALLLATNIVVLAGVAYNRSGEPDTRITLTERELMPLSSYSYENSGFSLWVIWRVLSSQEDDNYLYYSRPSVYSGYGGHPAWLDSKKLDTLGFDTDEIFQRGDDPDYYKIPVSREAYIVLEYDGDAYQQALAYAQATVNKEKKALAAKPEDEELQERVQKAERWLAFERIENSRLFAVDAGPDPELLRQQYSDRGRFIIARALVQAQYVDSCDETGVFGRIRQMHIDSIHVPLEFREQFDTILVPRTVRPDDPPTPPRYAVDLAYGGRLEPWIESVRQLSETVDQPTSELTH